MNYLRKAGKVFSLLATILFLFQLQASAQVQTARPGVSMISNSGGYYEYLPQGYSATGTTTYPLIIMLHGQGELGDGSATKLPMVLRNGVPYLINAGKFPVSFTSNGQTFKFIVITPQFKAWPTAGDIGGVISYCQSHYKVDASRIYLTGFSMGGGTLWNTIGDATVAPKIAAAVVFAGASYPSQAKANVIADNNIGVWAVHNDRDGTVSPTYTINWINYILARKSTAPVRKSIFSSTSHNCWINVYPDGYKEFDQNIYQFMLLFKKGAAVPTLPANRPPTASAGANKTVALPTTTVSLTGTGSDTDDGISKYAWTKVSGPTATISAPASAGTSISSLLAGTYVFRFTVTDKWQASTSSDVTVNVTGSTSGSTSSTGTVNSAPVANAGTDQSITLPTNTATLAGTGTDKDGTISKYRWKKVSGPTTFTLSDSTIAAPKLSNLVAGSYVFGLTVTDNAGATGTDNVTVTVNNSTTTKPTTFYATASADQTITLPTNSVTVSGKATDVGGTVSKYRWSKVSGPSTFTIKDSTATSTVISNLVAGTYTFRLTVYDASGVYTSDGVNITVLNSTSSSSTSATSATTTTTKPTKFYATAGPDQTVSLAVDSAILNGSATNVGGTTVKYTWFKIAGPAQYDFVDSMQAKAVVKNLVAGTYTFRLMAYDASGIYTSDAINITVSSTVAAGTVATSTKLSTLASDNSITVNPDPITDKFTLTVNNEYTGTMKVQLMNESGTSVKTYLLQKLTAGVCQNYLSASGVPAGNYYIKIDIGNYTESKEVTKQ